MLSSGVAAPKFIALLSIGCLLLSIVLLWVGVVGIMQRPIRMGDLMWLSLFGLGALLYTQLGKLLSPA